MPIQIVASNPNWSADFATVKRALRPALPPDVLIHHIGSTAVPGLVAKAIIDNHITLAALTDLNIRALTQAGFARRSPICDHCPPGLTLPAPDLAKRMFASTAPIPAHVHIREAARFNESYPLLCRDYLRAHPLAAAASEGETDRDSQRDSLEAGSRRVKAGSWVEMGLSS